MNTRVKANQVTKFLSKSTSFVFPVHFLFYRAGEERNRMKGRVVMDRSSYGKFCLLITSL